MDLAMLMAIMIEAWLSGERLGYRRGHVTSVVLSWISSPQTAISNGDPHAANLSIMVCFNEIDPVAHCLRTGI